MMRLTRSIVLVALLVGSAVAQESRPASAAARRIDPRSAGIGDWVADVTAQTANGETVALSTVAAQKPLVISFLGASDAYGPAAVERFKALIDAHSERIAFLEPTAPILGLRHGELMVLDAKRTVVYRGILDDDPAGRSPRRHYVRDAIEAALAGLPAPIPSADFATRSSNPLIAAYEEADLTWHRQISRLAQRRCQACHHEGGNGPFRLESAVDFQKRKTMIASVVESGQMPPWFAAKTSHAFQNDRSLSEREKAALLGWIAKDCPSGDPADAPLPRPFAKDWSIGKPDAVVAIPKPNKVPAAGEVRYRYHWVKTDFGEDKWIQKMEIRCSAPAVVHHVLVFLEEPPPEGRRYSRGRGQEGLTGYFAGLVPGETTSIYLDGRAKLLPKGATLKFQIHYTPNGKATEDLTEIGFIFAAKAPEVEITTKAASNVMLKIPPQDPAYTQSATFRFREDGWIYSFAPHMHLRGKAFRYDLALPDGKKITPLDVPHFDFNWQFRYELTTPLFVPKGTKLTATAVFDNSPNNPYNPDPTAAVRFGDQTSDEMLIGYFEFEPAGKSAAKSPETKEDSEEK